MDKKFCASFFVISFLTLTTFVHGQNVVTRSPSIEQNVEIDIENTSPNQKDSKGFDFANNEQSIVAKQTKRIPANIVANKNSVPPINYLGPIIFLITLPFAVWIMMAKKFNNKNTEKNVEYFPKTQQFKPYKTDYQSSSEDDDDIHYPKAG